MIVLLIVSLAVLAYVYGGYLLLLRLAVAVRGPRPVRKGDFQPTVSFVISAFNEADVIRKKLENTLELIYPKDRLEIAVISDASDDGTDAIVEEFADRGVKLFRQPVRRGKTSGLNAVVPHLTGEVVVFSDANAMYRRRALLNLTRNFADSAVGCVTGEARYVPGDGAADAGERAYWSYEMYVKRLETALGSMVGGDGAIYAIRRSLWRELPENAISDFLNPLQIVAAGWRSVYEPEAVCYEETAGVTGLEYRRRVRIVSRSWRAIFQAPGVLNPFRVGAFTWSLLSHKVLRWMTGVFAATAVASFAAVISAGLDRHALELAALSAGALAVAAATAPGRRALAMGAYFAALSVASFVGLLKGSLGNVSGIWTTPRADAAFVPRATGPLAPVGPLFLLAAGAMVTASLTAIPLGRPVGTQTVFWGGIGILAYIYAGYPLMLALLKRIARRMPAAAPYEPHVAVLIAANDEEGVIGAKIRNTLSLDYPADRLEVVVASDGSVDATNAIVERFAPRVRLLAFPARRGKAAAINDAVKQIRSEIIVFSDANTFLERGAVRALVRNFADEAVGAVSGDVRLEGERASLAYSEDLYYRYERWVQAAESAIGSMIGVDGALYAMRRKLFVAPRPDTILDDMAIPMAVIRAGYRVVFEPDACAHEQGTESAREEFARKSRVIAGAVQFLTRRESAVPLHTPQVVFSLVSHKALRWLSPAFVACVLLASLALAGESTWYAAAAGAQVMLLLVGLIGCVPSLRRLSAVSLAHYFCLVQAAAAVGFIRGSTGRQSVQWRRVSRSRVEMA